MVLLLIGKAEKYFCRFRTWRWGDSNYYDKESVGVSGSSSLPFSCKGKVGFLLSIVVLTHSAVPSALRRVH